jgi:TRAP transporter TAXI family solute receptor
MIKKARIGKLVRDLFFGLAALAALSLQSLFSMTASAQDTSSQRELVNSGVIGILGGGPGGTYIKLVHDLATLLDDGYATRVLPITGKGSIRAVEDLIYLRGIDAALVQSDILDFYKQNEVILDIDQKIQYITRLYNEEIHLLARYRFKSIRDLEGARVNFGPESSGGYLTAQLIFVQLGVLAEVSTYNHKTAMEKLLRGEIDAMVRVVGKPWDLAADQPLESNVHLLPIPSASVQGAYLPSNLTSKDYPNLIEPGTAIETIAVGAVMAVYNWPIDHPRRRKIDGFARRFRSNFNKLLGRPFHPKWHQVDWSIDIPGWQRFELSSINN